MREFAKAATGVRIIAALGDVEQAIVHYDMETAPFGTLRAMKHLTFGDGKIQTATLVFDTAPMLGNA